MNNKYKIITEYINQVIEDIPGTCIHKKAEYIIRCHNCEYFALPKQNMKICDAKNFYVMYNLIVFVVEENM